MAETMKDLRRKLQQINQANINSCETAAALVEGDWSRQGSAFNAFCAQYGVLTGKYADYAAAETGCGTRAGADDVAKTSPAPGDKDQEAVKARQPNNINIAWDVLRGDHINASDWLKSDRRMAEVMLSMTGTIIIRDGEVKPRMGWGDNDKFLDWIIDGGPGDFVMYRCPAGEPDDACLGMRDVAPGSLPVSASLKGRVTAEIDALTRAIIDDTPPPASAIALVNRTSLPLYRILNVQAAHAGPIITAQRAQIIDAVTLDLALTYLGEMITDIRARADAAPLAGQEAMELWRRRLEHITRRINARRLEGAKAYSAALEMAERVRLIEAQLAGRLGSALDTGATWNRILPAGR